MTDFDFDPDFNLAGFIAEPPHGNNYGRAADPFDEQGRKISFDPQLQVARSFMQASGFSIADSSTGTTGGGVLGARDAGMTAHRGVLHPDEYVDHEALVALVEDQLGVSYDEIHAVYKRAGGPLPAALRARRAELDMVFLRVANEGGDMTMLAEVVGLGTSTMDRILARARAAA